MGHQCDGHGLQRLKAMAREFARSILLEKIAYRSSVLGVPLVLFVTNAFGSFLIGVLMVIVSAVIGRPQIGLWAFAFSIFAGVFIHALMWRAASKDPHLETVLAMQIMPPDTRFGIIKGAPAKRFGRPRTRSLGRPAGRRYDP